MSVSKPFRIIERDGLLILQGNFQEYENPSIIVNASKSSSYDGWIIARDMKTITRLIHKYGNKFDIDRNLLYTIGLESMDKMLRRGNISRSEQLSKAMGITYTTLQKMFAFVPKELDPTKKYMIVEENVVQIEEPETKIGVTLENREPQEVVDDLIKRNIIPRVALNVEVIGRYYIFSYKRYTAVTAENREDLESIRTRITVDPYNGVWDSSLGLYLIPHRNKQKTKDFLSSIVSDKPRIETRKTAIFEKGKIIETLEDVYLIEYLDRLYVTTVDDRIGDYSFELGKILGGIWNRQQNAYVFDLDMIDEVRNILTGQSPESANEERVVRRPNVSVPRRRVSPRKKVVISGYLVDDEKPDFLYIVPPDNQKYDDPDFIDFMDENGGVWIGEIGAYRIGKEYSAMVKMYLTKFLKRDEQPDKKPEERRTSHEIPIISRDELEQKALEMMEKEIELINKKSMKKKLKGDRAELYKLKKEYEKALLILNPHNRDKKLNEIRLDILELSLRNSKLGSQENKSEILEKFTNDDGTINWEEVYSYLGTSHGELSDMKLKYYDEIRKLHDELESSRDSDKEREVIRGKIYKYYLKEGLNEKQWGDIMRNYESNDRKSWERIYEKYIAKPKVVSFQPIRTETPETPEEEEDYDEYDETGSEQEDEFQLSDEELDPELELGVYPISEENESDILSYILHVKSTMPMTRKDENIRRREVMVKNKRFIPGGNEPPEIPVKLGKVITYNRPEPDDDEPLEVLREDETFREVPRIPEYTIRTKSKRALREVYDIGEELPPFGGASILLRMKERFSMKKDEIRILLDKEEKTDSLRAETDVTIILNCPLEQRKARWVGKYNSSGRFVKYHVLGTYLQAVPTSDYPIDKIAFPTRTYQDMTLWFEVKPEFYNFVCNSDKIQSGDILNVILSGYPNPIKLRIGYVVSDTGTVSGTSLIVQDEELYQKEMEYFMTLKNEAKLLRMFLQQPLDDKNSRFRDFGRYILDTLLSKFNSSYNDDYIMELDEAIFRKLEEKNNAYNYTYLIEIARLKAYLGETFSEYTTFRDKISIVYYSPSMLANLPVEEMLPELYNNKNVRDFTKLEIVEFVNQIIRDYVHVWGRSAYKEYTLTMRYQPFVDISTTAVETKYKTPIGRVLLHSLSKKSPNENETERIHTFGRGILSEILGKTYDEAGIRELDRIITEKLPKFTVNSYLNALAKIDVYLKTIRIKFPTFYAIISEERYDPESLVNDVLTESITYPAFLSSIKQQNYSTEKLSDDIFSDTRIRSNEKTNNLLNLWAKEVPDSISYVGAKDACKGDVDQIQDIIYYYDDDIRYCFSITKLLQQLNEGDLINEMSGKPFREDFVRKVQSYRSSTVEYESKESGEQPEFTIQLAPGLMDLIRNDIRSLLSGSPEQSEKSDESPPIYEESLPIAKRKHRKRVSTKSKTEPPAVPRSVEPRIESNTCAMCNKAIEESVVKTATEDKIYKYCSIECMEKHELPRRRSRSAS